MDYNFYPCWIDGFQRLYSLTVNDFFVELALSDLDGSTLKKRTYFGKLLGPTLGMLGLGLCCK